MFEIVSDMFCMMVAIRNNDSFCDLYFTYRNN
jgi:hypothetical protein